MSCHDSNRHPYRWAYLYIWGPNEAEMECLFSHTRFPCTLHSSSSCSYGSSALRRSAVKWSVNLVLLLGKRLLGKQRWALAENDPHAVIVLVFFFFCMFESFRLPLRDENKGGEMARANASAEEDYLNHTVTYSCTDNVFQWARAIEVEHACGANLDVTLHKQCVI